MNASMHEPSARARTHARMQTPSSHSRVHTGDGRAESMRHDALLHITSTAGRCHTASASVGPVGSLGAVCNTIGAARNACRSAHSAKPIRSEPCHKGKKKWPRSSTDTAPRAPAWDAPSVASDRAWVWASAPELAPVQTSAADAAARKRRTFLPQARDCARVRAPGFARGAARCEPRRTGGGQDLRGRQAVATGRSLQSDALRRRTRCASTEPPKGHGRGAVQGHRAGQQAGAIRWHGLQLGGHRGKARRPQASAALASTVQRATYVGRHRCRWPMPAQHSWEPRTHACLARAHQPPSRFAAVDQYGASRRPTACRCAMQTGR